MTYYGRWTYKYEDRLEERGRRRPARPRDRPRGLSLSRWWSGAGAVRTSTSPRPTATPRGSRSRPGSHWRRPGRILKAAGQDFDMPSSDRRYPSRSGPVIARRRRRTSEVEERGHARSKSDPRTSSRRSRAPTPEAQGRIRRLHRALGSPRASTPTSGAIRSSTARPTTPPASPRSSRSLAAFSKFEPAAPPLDPLPRRDGRGEGPPGREILRRAPALPARSKTLADLNMDVINLWGRTRDVVSVGQGNTTLDDLLVRGRCCAGEDRRPRRRAREGDVLPLRPLRVRQAGGTGAQPQGRHGLPRQAPRLWQARKRDEYTTRRTITRSPTR